MNFSMPFSVSLSKPGIFVESFFYSTQIMSLKDKHLWTIGSRYFQNSQKLPTLNDLLGCFMPIASIFKQTLLFERRLCLKF